MNIEGMYTLVAAKIMDMSTFQMVWTTNDEIKALPDDNFCKMLGGALIDFKDDGTGYMFCNTGKTKADVPADELAEGLESGRVIEMDGYLYVAQPKNWKEEGGVIYTDSGEHGEVLGEAINPWKPVVELGNTIIIEDQYQFVPFGMTPTEVKKDVKEVKELSAEAKAAAGTYKGIYTKFVGDPDTAKNTDKEFSLELNEDGTGKSNRDDLNIKVPAWDLKDGVFTLTEKFLGTIDYTGKLEGNTLTLFNGDPENALTCMYVYEKN